jgi:hypothetical protein
MPQVTPVDSQFGTHRIRIGGEDARLRAVSFGLGEFLVAGEYGGESEEGAE